MQLGLVDAAHILPVCVNGSTDEVQNGLALLPQYHRAFDSGLIYLRCDYVMRINPVRVNQLETLGLGSGVVELTEPLGPIKLPSVKRHWPREDLINKGNLARGIDAQ
jgi:putative restriction endonuclease